MLHARSACAGDFYYKAKDGKTLEVMGMLIGKTDGNTFIILDALPIKKGDEASVQLNDDDYEYIVESVEKLKKVRSLRNMKG